ncbi:MAG TPA: class I SAM-dependent methyltransferase [Opitutaceae bacterium]|nr:class I SAM-dependent methyltransferase [Opitutaceae bacterium]
MSHGERSALLQILRCSQPVSALEVGTAHGGSLEQIRQFAQLTYSIDIDPGVRTRLAPEMPNVEFLTGDSAELIGVALQRCAERRQPPGFALIDGDHRYAGVQADIHALLRHQPSCPLWVLLHDSTNPECRRGIAEARWGDNPHVHLVDLDFVTGTTSNDAHLEGQMWGGLALALLLPEPRGGALEIAASASKNFRVLYGASVHSPISWQHWRQILLSKWGGVRRRLGRWR